MIFVTVGTQDKPFKRIFEMVENEIEKGTIQEEVVAQIGCTDFESDKMKVYKLMKKEQYLDYMKKATFVITHGGVGSIMDGIKMQKRVISIPRLKKYKEHVNDHQLQICEKFENDGYIIVAKNEEELESAIKNISKFKTKEYYDNNSNFVSKLKLAIDNL